MRRLVTSAGTFLVTLAFSVVIIAQAHAAPTTSGHTTPNSGQALEIAPPLLSLTVNPGQTVTAKIMLRDVSSSQLVVTNEIDDFVASGEDGTPKIITGNDSNNPYTLKDWIQPVSSFQMSPQQITNLSVTIKVPTDASPGGHYGVIRFTGTPPQLNGTGVSLSASLGALVLLTVNGHLTHHLSISNFSTTHNGKAHTIFQSAPLDFTVLLKNEGNIQEQPVGVITVKDMFSNPIASVTINSPPRNILPSSVRKFTGTLDSSNMGNRHLFGRYRAALTVTYGPNKQQTTSTLTFWVIPYTLIGVIVIALIIGALTIRYFLRWYKKHLIASIQKSDHGPSKK